MNIIDLLTELNIPIVQAGEHHHAREGWVQTDCPWCSPNSSSYRLGFNLAGSFCTCWACGPQPLWETVALLSGRPAGDLAPQLKQLSKGVSQERPHTGRLALPKGLGPLQPAHKAYLRQRGFKAPRLERLWRLQGLGHLGGRLAWRLFIPVYQRGEVVSWSTRAIGAAVKRYVNASTQDSTVPRSQVLYGQDYARHAVIACEGPTDVWAFGPGAVATLGLGYSQAQLNLLSKYPIRAVCFDNEPAAQRRAKQLVDQLAIYEGETYHIELDAKDAASAPRKDLNTIRKMIGL